MRAHDPGNMATARLICNPERRRDPPANFTVPLLAPIVRNASEKRYR
jgi:hypothetical protein